MAEFILKDRNGKGQTFNTDAIFVQGTDGELVQFTQGGGGANPDANDPVYYVTFMNGDQVLYVRPVVSGDTCPDVKAKGWITTPTKESDAQYNYTYYGWGDSSGAYDANILKNIQKDKTVYATYTSTLRSYTVTFYDEDGTTVLNSDTWLYGETPSYSISKPGFKPTWIPKITSVTGDASYTVQYTALEGELFGDNCVFSFKEGVLTIDGSGAMPDYTYQTYTERPWESQTPYITSVVIGDGVTSIGNAVFENSQALTSITIPNSVTRIGDRAFRLCTSLTSVDIPDSVTSVGSYAFADCSGLANVYISNSLTSIPHGMFTDCSSLASATIPNGVADIGPYAFNKTALTSITIPSGVKTIGFNAFVATKITSIVIPTSVSQIGSYCFSSCNQLTSATFEDTSGWYVSTSSSATSGTSVTLTNPTTNATYLKTTYKAYTWFNPTATA